MVIHQFHAGAVVLIDHTHVPAGPDVVPQVAHAVDDDAPMLGHEHVAGGLGDFPLTVWIGVVVQIAGVALHPSNDHVDACLLTTEGSHVAVQEGAAVQRQPPDRRGRGGQDPVRGPVAVSAGRGQGAVGPGPEAAADEGAQLAPITPVDGRPPAEIQPRAAVVDVEARRTIGIEQVGLVEHEVRAILIGDGRIGRGLLRDHRLGQGFEDDGGGAGLADQGVAQVDAG